MNNEARVVPERSTSGVFTDEQVLYLMRAASRFISKLDSNLTESERIDLIATIDRDEFCKSHNMTTDMVNALLDYVIPDFWRTAYNATA